MGKAPLPFDPVSACLCHAGCPTFDRWVTRYWVTVANPDVPRLNTGVFCEFDDVSGSFFDCFWREEPDVGPINISQIEKHPALFFPPRGYEVVFRFEEPFTPIVYRAQSDESETPCGSFYNLPKDVGPATWGPALLFPIQWWEDADDVPH